MSVELLGTRNIGAKTAGATSLGLTHTVPAGTNTALLGFASTGSGSAVSISTVAWDSAGVNEALTRRGGESGNGNDPNVRGSMWYKVAPTAGAAKTILVTPASTCEITIAAAAYQFVNQATPWRNASPILDNGTPSGGTPQPSAVVPSAVGDMVVGECHCNEGGGTNDVIAAGAGMTLIGQQSVGTDKHSSGSADAPGATSVTWAMTGVSNGNHWASLADSLVWDGTGSSGGGGGGTVPPGPTQRGRSMRRHRAPIAATQTDRRRGLIARALFATVGVSLGTGALTLTGFAPTVTASGNQNVQLGAGAATLTGFAPTIATTQFQAPRATVFIAHRRLRAHREPGARLLRDRHRIIQSAYVAPSSGSQNITLGSGSLAVTGFAPSVTASGNQTVALGVGALVVTGLAPTVLSGSGAVLGTGALVATGFAPTVTVTGNQSVVLGAGAATLIGFAPAVVASNHTMVALGVGVLTLTGFPPTVSQSGAQLGPSPHYFVARGTNTRFRSREGGPMMLFERKLREQLTISGTVYDRDDNRQSVEGVGDLRVNIFKQDMTPVIANDATHALIEETDEETAGDVKYSAPPGTIAVKGIYLMEFLCTIEGEPIAFPEQGYIRLVMS